MHDFKEELRRQRILFADCYEANPELAKIAHDMDAMFAQDEAEPIANYAERRGV